MVYPVLRCLVTPYIARPFRVSGIHGPDELFKVIVRPFATTTPESLLAPTSPLPRRVEISLYVASSLISSVMAPSVLLPPPPSMPAGRNHPFQVPTSSRGMVGRDASDTVRLATASLVRCVAQPAARTIKAVEASVTILHLTIEVF